VFNLLDRVNSDAVLEQPYTVAANITQPFILDPVTQLPNISFPAEPIGTAAPEATFLLQNDTWLIPVASFIHNTNPWILAYFLIASLLAIYFAAIYVKLRREFMTSLPTSNTFVQNWLQSHRLIRPISIRVSDKIETPLTYGILRPVILLPKTINWTNLNELEYILAHELVHIRRFDALGKLIMVTALCIHWFNPIVWIMCFLFNRDMEISCDEAVITLFGENSKQSYALTLIGMAQRGRRFPALLHNNFSKHAIEERITSIMKMKKANFIGTLMALILITTATVVFATTAINDNDPPASGNVANDTIANTFVDLPQSTQSQLNFYLIEFFSDEPGANDISMEEAAQIGASALEALFDADLNGVTIHMNFTAGVEAGTGTGQDTSWANNLVSSWATQLGMTVDQLLDTVRERSERNYTFENGLNLDNMASVVGLTSEEFMMPIQTVYIERRSVAVANNWASRLGMTLDQLFNDMMNGNDMSPMANRLGVEVDQFIHVLGDLWNITRTTWETVEQPSTWNGHIMPGNSYWAMFGFTINAETGALITANYSPWAIDTIDMPLERNRRMFADESIRIIPTAQHNDEYARLAMDIAYNFGILNNPISQAKIATTITGINQATGEPTNEIGVVIQCVDSNTALLIFGRNAANDPILTSIQITNFPPYSHLGFDWIAR